jgi:hypothetical protein
MATKVFALIVGIDDYPSAPLSGCLHDARRILDFLQKDPSLEVHARTLYDKEAEKPAVIEALRHHLGRAQAGDAAFFYFSGHGAQEWADPQAWPTESDRCLESIACYDPAGQASLLADKELRFLLHEIAAGTPDAPKAAPPHILTIFDCCHSGDNTRSAAFQEKAPVIRQRRFTHVFPQRPWEGFIFSDRFAQADFANRAIADLLPEAPHVQLAAALDHQPALEIGGEGLFTKNLLAVLERSGSGIAYASLHSLVSNYIRHQYQQNPQLYVQGGGADLMFSGFLGKPVESDGRLRGRVLYSKAEGWLLDAGAMQGISQDAKLRLKIGEGQWAEPTIRKLEPDVAFLEIDMDIRSQMDKAAAYPCEISASYPLRIWLRPQKDEGAALKALTGELEKQPGRLQVTEFEAEADYVLHLHAGYCFITPPFEHHYPLTALVPLAQDAARLPAALATLMRYLEHIANWEFVRRLHNASVRLFAKPPVKAEVFYEKGGQWVPLPYQEKGAAVEADALYWKEPQQTYGVRLKVELTNQFDRDLYYSLLFLTINFESNAGLMEKPVDVLKKGETRTVFAHRGGVIPFNLEQQILDFNQPQTHLWFQLLVSTQNDIEVARLTLPELAPPPGRLRKRAIPLDEDTVAEANPNDWTTQLIQLSIKNPRFEQGQKPEDILNAIISENKS